MGRVAAYKSTKIYSKEVEQILERKELVILAVLLSQNQQQLLLNKEFQQLILSKANGLRHILIEYSLENQVELS